MVNAGSLEMKLRGPIILATKSPKLAKHPKSKTVFGLPFLFHLGQDCFRYQA